MCRHGTHNDWSEDRSQVGYSDYESHDLSGMGRSQVHLVGNETVEHYAVEEHHKEQIRHRQSTIAADKPEEDQTAVDQEQSSDTGTLTNNGGRQSTGRS